MGDIKRALCICDRALYRVTVHFIDEIWGGIYERTQRGVIPLTIYVRGKK